MQHPRPVPRPAAASWLSTVVLSAPAAVLALVLAGCASGPAKNSAGGAPPAARGASSSTDRDGPEARPPANLAQVPDAEPRVETVRPGGANKPYQALGRDYVPLTGDPPFTERGLASWYGRKFQGRRTASGEPYDMYAMTAAHPTLPIPSYARIRNPANGREIVVRINDRGPFHSGRIVDLSYTAALKLDVLRGVAPVELERITYEEVRSGAWQRGGSSEARVAQAKPATIVAAPAVVVPSTMTVPVAAAPVADAPDPPAATSTAAMASPIATLSPPPPPAPAPAPPLPSPSPLASPTAGFYVQLGAFRERDGAEAFQRRVLVEAEWLQPALAVFGDSTYFRLQAGPYPSRDDANRAADRLRAELQLVPVIVERR